MMKKMLIAVAALCLSAGTLWANELQVVTEDWPPYNYAENGEITGMSTKIVKAIMDKAGVKGTFDLYPWERSYSLALESENTLIYTIIRHEKREPLFQWVGPIVQSPKTYVYKLAERKDVKVGSFEDAKKFKTGVVKDDFTHQLLVKNGLQDDQHLEFATDEEYNIKKLFAKKIELITGDDFTMPIRLKRLGLSFDKLEKTVLLYEDPKGYYMALSNKTPKDIHEKLSKACEELEKSGALEKIRTDFMKGIRGKK